MIMSVKEYLNTVKITMYRIVFTRCAFYNLLLFFVLLAYLTSNIEGYFRSKVFILVAEGARLENNVMKEIETYDEIECSHLCLSEYPLCKSINYETKEKPNSRHTCQLNNATKSLQPENVVKDKSFKYFEMMEENVDETNPVPKSCSDLYKKGERKDGVYTIDPDSLGSFDVSCDMTRSGGGWTVFQRRVDGSVDFYRGWKNYTEGFGDLNGEFWLGLDKIYRLTRSGQNVLRVDLENFENETRYADYSTFTVADETNKYMLTVGGYSGNAGDSLAWHDGMKFSTIDADNDKDVARICAVVFKGAWWYNSCRHSNLNGPYLGDNGIKKYGITWYYWKDYSLKKTEMKICPRSL